MFGLAASPSGQCRAPSSLFCTLMAFCRLAKVLHFVLFADYTNIFCSEDNLQKLQTQFKDKQTKMIIKMWYKDTIFKRYRDKVGVG